MDLSRVRGNTNTRCAFAALLLLALFVSTNGHAQVNKCNINGKIVYTDIECPEDTAGQLILQPLNTTSIKPSAGKSRKDGKSSYNSSTWFNDSAGYARALKLSREKNAPIFIYAYTDWCGYCKKLKKNMFADAGVRRALSGYVKVKINPEHSAADQKLFNRWGGRGFPTLYLQTTATVPPARTSGPFIRENGKWKMMGKNAFIAMLESNL